MASSWTIQHKLKFLPRTALVFILSFSLFSAVTVPAAQAGGYHYKTYSGHHGHHYKKRYHHRKHYNRGHRYNRHHYGHYNRRHHRRNNGAAIAAGVIGLAAGAIIASEISRNKRQKYRYHNRHVSYEPYSSGWYRACARKYRSFNPDTGRYLTYSGKYKLCRL